MSKLMHELWCNASPNFPVPSCVGMGVGGKHVLVWHFA